MNEDDTTRELDPRDTTEGSAALDAAQEQPVGVPPPLLSIPGFGEPSEAPDQVARPIADGTPPAPDLADGRRTQALHPRDDADRVRGKIVAESIAQHADHLIGSRLGPLMESAVRVRTLDDDLISANAAAEQIATAPGEGPPDPPPTTMRGRMAARMAAGGWLLALFFAVGIAEALFAYDGFRELARFRTSDPDVLREGAPALSAIVIALLIAVGQKSCGKNLRLANAKDPQPSGDGRRPLLDRDLSRTARYGVAVAIIVTGLGLWYGVQSARTTANNAAAARQQANQAAGARGSAAERLTQNTQPSASEPGVYFLVSASVFLLGIGVAYLLVDPLREARARESLRNAATLAHRDRIRAQLGSELGALVAQRAEIATTVANARRQMHQEAVLHPEVDFLRRADEFPHLYGTWSARSEAPSHAMPDVGEAHHAQVSLARDSGLTVPDKLADVDALIAELLGRKLAGPKSLPE
ncbi:MAG TPA: hypothetical protein VGR11_02005 [Solirubrobacteraceae bacterium]|nr:hypothetical protein [Solirubrobacteraceae bacterium]